jgi:tetratricopeptide (TPR) repeat protein
MYAGLSLVYLAKSDLGRAYELAHKSVEAAESADDQFELVYSLDTLAQVALIKQDWKTAEELLQRAISIHDSDDQPPFAAYALRRYAEELVRRGNMPEGLQRLQSALEIFQRLNLRKEIDNTQRRLSILNSSRF